MNIEPSDYKMFLRGELHKRCQKNPNYSLRGFARALQIDPGILSRVLANKRTFSDRVARRVIKNLSMSPEAGHRCQARSPPSP